MTGTDAAIVWIALGCVIVLATLAGMIAVAAGVAGAASLDDAGDEDADGDAVVHYGVGS